MPPALAVLLQFISYLVSASVVFVWALAIVRPSRAGLAKLAAISLGTGQTAISFVLTLLIRLIPHQTLGFYAWLLSGFFLAALVAGIAIAKPALERAWVELKRPKSASVGPSWGRVVGWAVVVALILVIVGASTLKRGGNDQLEYLQVARVLVDLRDLGDYPYNDPSKTKGFYAGSTHPPAYAGLIAWSYIIQGSSDTPGAAMLVAPSLLLASWTLFVAAMQPCGATAMLVGSGAFFSSPLLLRNTASGHIDPLTLFGVFAALVALGHVLRKPTLRRIAAHGVLLGLAFYGHSIAVLLIPISCSIALLSASTPPFRRALYCLMSPCIGLLLVCVYLVQNYRNLGYIIGDKTPLWAIDTLRYDSDRAIIRSLDGLAERLVVGVGGVFSNTLLHGPIYWIAALVCLGVVLTRRSRRQPWTTALSEFRRMDDLQIHAWAALAYWAILLSSALVGLDTLIKNPRYVLPMHSSVALVAGWGLSRVLVVLKSKRGSQRGWIDSLRRCGGELLTLLTVVLLIPQAATRDLVNGLLAERLPRVFEYVYDETLALRDAAPLEIVKFADRALDSNDRVLALQQAHFAYYGATRYVSHYDPSLLPIFSADADKALSLLKDHGITHIFVPPYAESVVYRGPLKDILANPNVSRPIASREGYVLYVLKHAESWSFPPIADSELRERVGWSEVWCGGEAGQRIVHGAPAYFGRQPVSDLIASLPAIACQQLQGASTQGVRTLEPGLYSFEMELEGRGHITVELRGWNADGLVHAQTLWSGVLDNERSLIAVQHRLEGERLSYHVAARLRGRGHLTPLRHRVVPIDVALPSDPERPQVSIP